MCRLLYRRLFPDLALDVVKRPIGADKLIRVGGGFGVGDAFPLLAVNRKNPLPLQKVMHTRKRHMELFQELNQKFQTLDRFRDIPNMGSMVSNRGRKKEKKKRKKEQQQRVGGGWVVLAEAEAEQRSG